MNLPRTQALTRKAQAILERPDLALVQPELHLENLALRTHCAALEQELSSSVDRDLPRLLADQALSNLTATILPLIAARVRYACSHVAIGLGEFGDAEAHLRIALDVIPTDDDPRMVMGSMPEFRLRVSALSALGLIQHLRGEFLQALETQTHAYQLAIRPPQPLGTGQVRTSGYADTSNRPGYPFGAAVSLNRIGMGHERLGDYTAAIDTHQRCLVLREELGDDFGKATSLNSLANIYLQIEKPEIALPFYEQALQLCRKIGFAALEGNILSNMGLAFHLLGRFEEAIGQHRAALKSHRDVNEPYSEANALSSLGRSLLASDRFAEADDCLRESLRMSRQFGDRHGIATCLTMLGRLHSTVRDPNTGGLLDEKSYQPLLDEALEHAGHTGSLKLTIDAHAVYAEAHKRRGKFESALSHTEKVSAGKEELFKAQTVEQARTLQLKHEMEQSRKEAEIHRLRSVELAAALQEAETQRNLAERLSHEDALTGLSTRRRGDQLLAVAFTDSVETGKPLSVVLADADHFKAINDRFSHLTGDMVLRQLAVICRQACRASDIGIRFGGEELLFVLPNTDLAEAVAWSEGLRLAVATYPWQTIHPEITVRLSLGATARTHSTARIVATRPEAIVHAVDTLIRAADARLYEAKAAGRNCVRS